MPLTPEEKRARHQAYMRRYRELHPDRQEESRRYWQKNKKAILAKRKEKPRTDKDRERDSAYAKRYRKNKPEKGAAASARWYQKNHAVIRTKARGLKHLSQEAEAGRPRPDLCEICSKPDIGRWKTLHFDHCHQRGVFRGWICNSCNVVLGYVNDDPDHLRKLIAYLERTKDIIPPQLTLPV